MLIQDVRTNLSIRNAILGQLCDGQATTSSVTPGWDAQSPIHEDFVTAEEFGIVVLLTLIQHSIHQALSYASVDY